MELEGCSQGHVAQAAAKSSPDHPCEAGMPCVTPFTPSSSGKATACPKNPHLSLTQTSFAAYSACDFFSCSLVDTNPVSSFPLCLNIWIIISCVPLPSSLLRTARACSCHLPASIAFSKALSTLCWTLSRSCLKSGSQNLDCSLQLRLRQPRVEQKGYAPVEDG